MSEPCLNGGECVRVSSEEYFCICNSSCPCADMGFNCEIGTFFRVLPNLFLRFLTGKLQSNKMCSDPFDCTFEATGTTRSHINDCSFYIECINGEPVTRNCGNETAYDPILGVCDFYPEVLDRCVNGTNYTTGVYMTTTETPTG